jgi:hypothetical protein
MLDVHYKEFTANKSSNGTKKITIVIDRDFEEGAETFDGWFPNHEAMEKYLKAKDQWDNDKYYMRGGQHYSGQQYVEKKLWGPEFTIERRNVVDE